MSIAGERQQRQRTEPSLGEIRALGGDVDAHRWARCDGRLLAIADHAPLYSLLGTTHGGDGVETFALPDLPGSVIALAGVFRAGARHRRYAGRP